MGDIHGQYGDLRNVLSKKNPDKNNFMFLGDYVDRGNFSIECALLLFAIKLNYPSTFGMLRGNHESRQCAEHFTFRKDCILKYDEEVYECFMTAFDALPLMGIVNNEYLCMHGGLSPKFTDLKALNEIDRFNEIPSEGLLCDLVWADPVADDVASKKVFTKNKERACSVKFGLKPLKHILKETKMQMVVRAHQVQMEGFKFHHWEDESVPSIVTVFSAADYCGVYKNRGAIILVTDGNFNIQGYQSHPSAYYLPKNQDLFSFSISYLAVKVMEIFNSCLVMADDSHEEVSSDE